MHVGDLAANLGVSKGALLKRLSDSPPEGYVLVGEDLIRKDGLQRLASMINCGSSLEELSRKLREEGIGDPIALIHHLGFTIKWRGLNSAEVVKTQNSK